MSKDPDFEELIPSMRDGSKSPTMKRSTSTSSVTSFKVSIIRDGEVKTCNVPCLSVFDENFQKRFCIEMRHLHDKFFIIVFHVFWLFYMATTVFRNVAYKHHIPGETLWDLGYELLPHTAFAKWLSEYVLGANIIVTVLCACFIPFFSDRPHSRGIGMVKIAIQMLTMNSIGHTLRFFTYSVTGLPGPADHCKPGEPYSTFDGNVWTHVGGPGKPNCGDLMFSGHMLQVLNFTLAMHHHRHKYFEKAFVRIGVMWFLWLTVVVQAICIIMARNHYTVDVVAACYVAPMLWYTLQNIYESPTFKRLFPSYMSNFKYDYASCSSDCEDIPIVKCMMRLGSFISRRVGFSVRVSSFFTFSNTITLTSS